VATYSTGVTASFGGTPITEIVGLSVAYGSGMPEGRGTQYKPLPGQVQVESLGGASTGFWGVMASLVLSGGGVSLTNLAVCTDVGAVAEVNGVTRYSYTFDLIGQ
jgi:hypothetical protein